MTQSSSPQALLAALAQLDPAAQQQYRQLIEPSVHKLLQRLVVEFDLPYRVDTLLHYALGAAELFARTRNRALFKPQSWAELVGAVLVYVGRIALLPFSDEPIPQPVCTPPTLPWMAGYQLELFSVPYEALGPAHASGDWVGCRVADDGTLWLLIADVAQHGYVAWLLAGALPDIWELCWQNRQHGDQPVHLLRSIHHLLDGHLPEGIFIECTVARLTPEGELTVAPAGSRVLIRNGTPRQSQLIRLASLPIANGFPAPAPANVRTWHLLPDDEAALLTDGLIDQVSRTGFALDEWLRQERGLLATISDLLERSLAKSPPMDDITVVVCRRLAGSHPQRGQ
jgi:hypothetical protein